MRAHSQRRIIWILNGVLGLALAAVAAWFVLDVRPAIATPDQLRPKEADLAVEAFQNLPDGETSGPPLAVEQKELDEIDVPKFKVPGRGRYHWLYSGPMPPEPPKEEVKEGPKAPVISDLEKLGRVHLLIYIPPRRGETIASETVIAWRFAAPAGKSAVDEFRPGQFIVEPGKERGNIRIADVVPKGGGLYEILYEVYDEAYKLDEVPEGEPASRGVYPYDGRAPLDQKIQERIRVTGPGEASGATGAGGGGEGSTTAVIPGTAPEAALPDAPVEPPSVEAVRPTVTWENARKARVEFDQGTYDYLRSANAQDAAKGVKTQVAKDAQGQVLGLQFTGISDDSPARKFDVRRGDILVSIDGRPVGSRDDALNIIQGMDPNVTSVTVVILRDGKEITYVIDPQDPKTRRDARMLDNVR